jgi:DNA-binding NtrC family response regulator
VIKPKILIVDDERDIRECLGNHLKLRFNCDVILRSNGTEAIEALESGDCHVLLQDLHMPGIDGYTVLRHAKKIKPEMIMIVVTRLNNSLEIKMVEDLGATYLAKPFELKTVEMILQRKLEQHGGFDYKV